MIITGLTDHQISYALDKVNQKYFGNLSFADGINSYSDNRHRLRLRVKDSRGAGARRSASERRTVSACWHASRDFYRALFDVNSDTKICTALAKYSNWDDFEDKYKSTYDTNVGSMMQPAMFGDLCDCEG